MTKKPAVKKPGQRKQQILEALVDMLQSPKPEKITTAALSSKLSISEAALYRHFASKAQMFEGLIEFIETSLFGIINKILDEEHEGIAQARKIVSVMLIFAEKNPGITRILTGDALVNEDVRLQLRINQVFDRIESTLKQSLRIAENQTERNIFTEAHANLLISFVIGRWSQFAKSSFKRKPTEYMEQQFLTFKGWKSKS